MRPALSLVHPRRRSGQKLCFRNFCESLHRDSNQLFSNLQGENPGSFVLNKKKLVCSRTSKKRKDELALPFSILYFHSFNIQGPYVVNLTNCLVTSLEEVQRWLAVGNRKRVVASTSQNEHSSRSHIIFSITLSQSELF
jgi:hypothetical protein